MKKIGFFIAFLSVIIFTPFILEYKVFQSDKYSALTNGEWASFLGSYLGSIVGAVGIFITLYFTGEENIKMIKAAKEENENSIAASREENIKMIEAAKEENENSIVASGVENEKMRRSELRPYLVYLHRSYNEDIVHDCKVIPTPKKSASNTLFIDTERDPYGPRDKSGQIILIKNLGKQAAIEIKVIKYKTERKNTETEGYEKIPLYYDIEGNYSIEYIQSNEEGYIVLPEVINKNCRCEFVISFKDVLGRIYFNKVTVDDDEKIFISDTNEDKVSFSLDCFEDLKVK